MSTGTIRLENTEKGVFTGTCSCDCGGGGGGECPHPSVPFSGTAMAGFAKTQRAVAVQKGDGDGELKYVRKACDESKKFPFPNDIAISDDGTLVWAVGEESPFETLSEYINIFKWNGEKYELQPNPEQFSNVAARGVAMTSDGSRVVVLRYYYPTITVYGWNGEKYVKLADPDVMPGYGRPNSIAMTPDGSRMVLYSHSEPYLYAYDWNGEKYIKQPDPSVLPNWGNAGSGIDISDDGMVMIVGHTNYGGRIPLFAYQFNGTRFVSRQIDVQPPAVSIYQVTMSSDGNRFACCYQKDDGSSHRPLSLYEWDGVKYVKQPDPSEYWAGHIDMSGDGTILVGGSNKYIRWIGDEVSYHTLYEADGTFPAKITITKDGKRIAVVTNVRDDEGKSIVFYWLDEASMGTKEIHPFTTLAEAVAIEGFKGVGFTAEAITDGEVGTMELMFE